MATVSVTIAGRVYRMACAEGEEAHLEGLAQVVDAKINELRGAFGEIGDQRLTVMASISILDETNDLKTRIAKLEAQVESLNAQKASAETIGESWSQELANVLEDSASRIERLAKRIAQPK